MKASPPKIHCLIESNGRPFSIEVFVLYQKSQTFQLLHQVNTIHPIPEKNLQGYVDKMQDCQRYSIPEEKYWSILQKLDGLSLSVLPSFSGGFDGETYHIWLRSGLSESSFRWWGDCPTHWRVLKIVFDEIVSLTTA